MSKMNVNSPVTGTVWKIEIQEGNQVSEGDVIMILESMKMEIPVESPKTGTLVSVLVQETTSIDEDQILCVVE